MSSISGVLQQFWGKAESTYDTHTAIAATDGLDAVSLEITPEKSYEEIISHRGTGTHQGEIDGATGGKWSLAVDVAPAAAGTAPDVGFVIKAALGDETVSGGASVTYDFNDSAPESLTFTKYDGASFVERINGAWVESMTIEGAKGGIPKLTFSGGFATYAYLYGNPVVNGNHSSSDTTIDLDTGHGYQIGIGAIIKFGSEDNSGAGYRVTDRTASQVTITPGLANGISDDAVVAPLVPSQTLGGTRIGGVSHGMSIDSTSVNPISMKWTVNTGIRALDKESSSSKPTAIMRAETRTVDFEHELYFLHANVGYLGAAHFSSQVTRDLQSRYGANTAAARMLVNADKCLVKVQGAPVQDGEISTIKLMGRARQNSAAMDEFSVVFS